MANPGCRISVRVLSCLILLLLTIPAYAQYSSNIQGVVSDPAGAAINGAKVDLRNAETGVTASVTTTESGNYRFSSLPPGNYVVAAEAKGFKKAEANFTLETSETKGINLALVAGNLQLRFDILNLFNHGNLGGVDPNMADGTFGKVTSTLNPYDARKIELGLRVSF